MRKECGKGESKDKKKKGNQAECRDGRNDGGKEAKRMDYGSKEGKTGGWKLEGRKD